MLEEFINRIKKFLKTTKGFKNKDWEIVWMDMDEIDEKLKLHWPKALVFAYKLKEGAIFPPIILNDENKIFDGKSRLGAYYLAEEKKIPALISVKNKDGKRIGKGRLLGDKVYQPLIETFKELNFYLPEIRTKNVTCMGCHAPLVIDKVLTPNSKNLHCTFCKVWTDPLPKITWAIIPK